MCCFGDVRMLDRPSLTEFDLAPLGTGKLRIYLGNLGTGPADFYRVDDAGVPASALTGGTNNPGWMKLSSATNGTPGFGSFDFCSGQCSYDMVVASPAGHPDSVWISGQMQYGELLNRSNGRTVQRSIDAGVNFTGMTNVASFNGMHPDQHALVFDPENPDIAFAGSDGGLVRTSGVFTDQAHDGQRCSFERSQVSSDGLAFFVAATFVATFVAT